jgi:hypothetical protein
MADDIRITYGSSGFERVIKELRDMEKIGATSGTWFKSMQQSVKDAEAANLEFDNSLRTVGSGLVNVAGALGKVVIGVTAVAATVTGVGVAAFTSWTMSMLKTTEGFRMMEVSLFGALKSWDKVKVVSEFAKEYASVYPAMYKDVMQAMQSLAFIPAMKPVIERGDVERMKEFMGIVQGMITIRPEQGVQGAIYALREALAGNWRSLMMRFDIPIASIAASAGMTMEEMKAGPQSALKALKGWIDAFVGADTMALAAKNLSIQVGNLKDKYDIWLDKLGKTGIYQKVVDYLLDMNDALERFMASDKVQRWTVQINKFLEEVVDRIAGVFTKGIDWEGISSLGGLVDAIKKVGSNAVEELMKVWELAKEPLANALKGVFKFMAEAAIGATTELFIPVGKSIAMGIERGMQDYRSEHPFKAVEVESAVGGGIGLLAGGLKGGIVGALAAPSLRGYAEIIGVITKGGAEGLGSIEKKLSDLFGAGLKDKVGKIPSLSDQLGLEQAKKSLKEIQDILKLPWIGNEGFRAALGLEPTIAGKAMKWPARFPFLEETEKVEEAWKPKPEQMLERYSAWSRMAGMLAGKEEVPYEKRPFYQWYTGKMSLEEYQKTRKIEEFNAERQKRLTEILETPETKKDFGVQAKIYGEMFSIAYQKGDFRKAEDYMNKNLEALVNQMKKEEMRGEKDTDNLRTVASNTGEMVSLMEKWGVKDKPGTYSNIPAAERDEIRNLVGGGLGES